MKTYIVGLRGGARTHDLCEALLAPEVGLEPTISEKPSRPLRWDLNPRSLRIHSRQARGTPPPHWPAGNTIARPPGCICQPPSWDSNPGPGTLTQEKSQKGQDTQDIHKNKAYEKHRDKRQSPLSYRSVAVTHCLVGQLSGGLEGEISVGPPNVLPTEYYPHLKRPPET